MSNVAFNNVEDMLAFFQQHKDAVNKLVSTGSAVPAPKDAAHATDALGQRDVVAQAQQEATAPAKAKSGPSTAPKLMPKFGSKSQDARNAMRLVNGPDSLFVSVTRFGINFYVPDFRLNHRLIHRFNRIIMSNKRFYDSSEFFHPLVAHIYFGIIEIVHVFRVLEQVGQLSTEQHDFLDWFKSTFSYEALPVPGFLRNQLNTLAASSPALNSYDNVVPRLPATPQASDNTLYTICDVNNATYGNALVYSYRIPNIGALMTQLRAITAIASANAATAAQVQTWPDFGTTLFGFNLFGGNAGAPTHPANDRAQTPLRNGVHQATACLVGSPGFETYVNPPRAVASSFLDYAADIQALLPAMPGTYASQLEITWRQYTCLDRSFQWFIEFARVMSFYCQFSKDSTNLGAITPIGNAANQVVYTPVAPPANRPNSRYPVVEITARGALFTLSVPEADATDSAIGLLNLGTFYPVNDNPRGGPFFTDLPVVKRTRVLTPENGYGQVLTDHYRLANAEQPVLE